MRPIRRHRNVHPLKAPRIAISEEEILADLVYPATRLPSGKIARVARRGRR